MIINEITRKFIAEHQNDDVRQLALRGCKSPEIDFRFALQQIEGRQKAKDKIPEFYANVEMLFPPSVSMEQCSSSATAKYKASLIKGRTFADLSGGFGVDTFFFAQRFESGWYVEPQSSLCQLLEHNLTVLQVHHVSICNDTMENVLPTMQKVDYIYLDPSRRDNYGNRVVTLEDCTPNLLQWKDMLLSKAEEGVMVKLSPMIDIKKTLQQLPETVEIHVVAVKGECKEVLFLLADHRVGEVKITATDIRPTGDVEYSFFLSEELESLPTIKGSIERYLYEPNAAVLKAAGFKSIATRYNLHKLHRNTHLYTSHQLVDAFPGRIFEVQEVLPFKKKTVKTHFSTMEKANVAVRNFPLTVDELKKDLKLKDGGDCYVFGTTCTPDEKVIVVCQKAEK